MLVSGAVADKPARLVRADEPIHVVGPPAPFVSRGGVKLDAALDRFGIDVAHRHGLDAGASTGGFTDCLLQRGAAHVFAVDVGHGQLHERIRGDPRVTVLERTDVRALRLDTPVDVVTADLSFISLTVAGASLVGPNAAPGADVVALVKPQFEAGRAEASKGRGVIRHPEVWRRTLTRVMEALAAEGAVLLGAMVSPLRGAEGNVEFLLHLRAHAGPEAGPPVDLDAVVEAAAAG